MKGKRILFTSTDAMAFHFLTPYIKMLLDQGHIVELGCSQLKGYRERLEGVLNDEYQVKIHDIRLHRSPFDLRNIRGYQDMKKVVQEGQFDLICTNEPVMGLITRLCAKKNRKHGTKVIYTAHGFHFFKGAPMLNWLIYYPVEVLASYITDALVVINKEDYAIANKKMHAKEVVYIPGIGLDTHKYNAISINIDHKRAEIGIPKEAILLFSVGELGARKNHQVIIKALTKIKNDKIFYAICGEGELKNELIELSKAGGLDKRVVLLGYRRDVGEICKAADIFVHPSCREGLGIAALEAMSAGLPLITSNINGIQDYSINGHSGFSVAPFDVDGFANAIEKLSNNQDLREKMGQNNIKDVEKFDVENVKNIMDKVYGKMLNG